MTGAVENERALVTKKGQSVRSEGKKRGVLQPEERKGYLRNKGWMKAEASGSRIRNTRGQGTRQVKSPRPKEKYASPRGRYIKEGRGRKKGRG